MAKKSSIITKTGNCVDQENQSQQKCERNVLTPAGIITTYHYFFSSHRTTLEALQVLFYQV
jgi:hypothetical protein